MLQDLVIKANHFKNVKIEEYYEVVKDLIEHPITNEMKKYIHHCDTDCFQHCVNTSYYNYCICKMLHLNAKAAARAGLLHDLFLYDWRTHKSETGDGLHAYTHPGRSLHIAKHYFTLTKLEQSIIREHMWPVTLLDPPTSAESFIMTLTDKYCGLCEFVTYYTDKLPISRHGAKRRMEASKAEKNDKM